MPDPIPECMVHFAAIHRKVTCNDRRTHGEDRKNNQHNDPLL